jgi:molybdopterin converting factor small subunit
MKVEVRVLGLFSQKFIKKVMIIELQSKASVDDLFKQADKKLGDSLFRSLVDKKTQSTILLSGRLLEIPGDLKKEVREGDVLSLLSPVAGG